MEEGDYWECFEISENENDNEIDIIGSFRNAQKSCSSISEDRLNGKLYVMRRGTQKDSIVCSRRKDAPTQKCHGVVALLSKKTLGMQRYFYRHKRDTNQHEVSPSPNERQFSGSYI
uniref:Uncharacterized protein n=1 Tax=Glossina palpalis gambiensis TaxID=67801 RepID=A0A1B0ASH9_9MUSC